MHHELESCYMPLIMYMVMWVLYSPISLASGLLAYSRIGVHYGFRTNLLRLFSLFAVVNP